MLQWACEDISAQASHKLRSFPRERECLLAKHVEGQIWTPACAAVSGARTTAGFLRDTPMTERQVTVPGKGGAYRVPHALTVAAAVVVLVAGLPVAVWLDLRNLSDAVLRRQAGDINSLISSMRGYYATNVVARVLAHPESTSVAHHYHAVPGAIPIPATLSLELGRVVNEQQHNIAYRFVSDYPFKSRQPHVLDAFEQHALEALRENPKQEITSSSWSIFADRVRLVTPVIMDAACVACHNSHPESPKRDWKIGDVRGIQEVTITQPIAANLFSFKFLLIYFALVSCAVLAFLVIQRRHAFAIQGLYRELEAANRSARAGKRAQSQFVAGMSHGATAREQRGATAPD
jgi:hypothetical protein